MSEAKPFDTNCPNCGAARVEGVRYCPNCGHDLFALEPEPGTRSKGSGQTPPGRHKSIGLTLILAIIFPGLGHMYAGRWTRGLTIMLGFIVVLLVIGAVLALLGASLVGLVCAPIVIIGGLLLFIPFELWQIFDAIGSSAAVNMGRA
ncbi:MAG: zinc ribbon domain-containing protein [Methanomassiliicoccales archaeon]|nr:zinc ribbon domain-containing protein [Methanomassiliicoccales archaeon]